MGVVIVIDERVPWAAWSRNRGVGTSWRAAVIPNNDDVGSAVQRRQVRESLPVGPTGDIVHAVADLKFFAERQTAGLLIVAKRTFEDTLDLLYVGPQQALWIVLVQGMADVGAGTIVIRRPPDFIGAGVGCG